MGFPLFSMEWPAQRSAGGAHEGSRWAAQRTHRMQAASGCAPEGAHEPCSTIHAPRRGAGHAGTKTGGCGSPAGRTCPPATFIGPLRGRDWPIPISHSTENSGELKWVLGLYPMLESHHRRATFRAASRRRWRSTHRDGARTRSRRRPRYAGPAGGRGRH